MKNFLKAVVVFFIAIYQKTISPDHGLFSYKHPHGFCRFTPTCSGYAKEAVIMYGVGKGAWLAIKRVLSCHPWSQGGYDPVPPEGASSKFNRSN